MDKDNIEMELVLQQCIGSYFLPPSGFPAKKAANVALKVTRNWLEDFCEELKHYLMLESGRKHECYLNF